MITYITKDITTVTMGIVAHGVNCQGVMGSGVAKAIRDKWPAVYKEYIQQPIGRTMLGTTHMVQIKDDDSLFVANCYTQIFYGKGGRFASPDAIRQCLNFVYDWSHFWHGLPIFMPKIGCGLGGLNWEKDVEPIVEDLNKKWSPFIQTYICDI